MVLSGLSCIFLLEMEVKVGSGNPEVVSHWDRPGLREGGVPTQDRPHWMTERGLRMSEIRKMSRPHGQGFLTILLFSVKKI
jgi:hypothetical protein